MLLKQYHAAKDLTTLKSISNAIIELYDTYIKSVRFALAKAFNTIEELENKRG